MKWLSLVAMDEIWGAYGPFKLIKFVHQQIKAFLYLQGTLHWTSSMPAFEHLCLDNLIFVFISVTELLQRNQNIL